MIFGRFLQHPAGSDGRNHRPGWAFFEHLFLETSTLPLRISMLNQSANLNLNGNFSRQALRIGSSRFI